MSSHLTLPSISSASRGVCQLPSISTQLGDILNPRKRSAADSVEHDFRPFKSLRLEPSFPHISTRSPFDTPVSRPTSSRSFSMSSESHSLHSLTSAVYPSRRAVSDASTCEHRRIVLPPLASSPTASTSSSSWSPSYMHRDLSSMPALSRASSSAASSPDLAPRFLASNAAVFTALPATSSIHPTKPALSARDVRIYSPTQHTSQLPQQAQHYTWSSAPADAASADRKRRGNLPKESTALLNAWFCAHARYPYPKEEEKHRLQVETGLSMSQISNWFINARRRRRPAMALAVAGEALRV